MRDGGGEKNAGGSAVLLWRSLVTIFAKQLRSFSLFMVSVYLPELVLTAKCRAGEVNCLMPLVLSISLLEFIRCCQALWT